LLDAYPADPTAASESPNEQQILGAAFQALGFEIPEGLLDISKLQELLRRDGHSLASLEDRHFSSMIEVNKDSARLRRNFIPQTFNGDVLLFTAALDASIQVQDLNSGCAISMGKPRSHPISCRHEHMMQSGPLAEIGHMLADELSNVSPSKLLDSLRTDPSLQALCSEPIN
jgi:hypothetical protein